MSANLLRRSFGNRVKPSTSNKIVILRACDFIDLSCETLDLNKIVILRACGFIDLSCETLDLNKIVILSAAPNRSIAFHGACSAESKDPGGAYLTDAARSFSTTEARTGRTLCGLV